MRRLFPLFLTGLIILLCYGGNPGAHLMGCLSCPGVLGRHNGTFEVMDKSSTIKAALYLALVTATYNLDLSPAFDNSVDFKYASIGLVGEIKTLL